MFTARVEQGGQGDRDRAYAEIGGGLYRDSLQ